MSDLNQRLAKLSPEKRELLRSLLLEKNKEPLATIPRRKETAACLQSFAQQRLWFLEQLEPGNPAYRISVTLRMEGHLDVTLLTQSLNRMVQRHEALRTTFALLEGQPVQVIGPALTVPLPVIDLRPLAESEREVQARESIAEVVQRPFDLSQGPLFRAGLWQLADQQYWLLLTMHHMISDDWSMQVFLHELALLYNAACTGEPAPLPALSIQYADVSAWQREWLQGPVLEAELGYWSQRLAGSPAVLELPTDRPRPAIQTFRGASQTLVLPDSLTEALKTLSQREGVTLFMTLLAAFQTLLHRYSGQADILVGVPVAGRARPEVENLIGLFTNTVVMRTDCSGNPRFRDLLRQVRQVTLGAYAHQELPFEKLVDALQPVRDLSRNPIFQVMFVLQGNLKAPVAWQGLRLRPQTLGNAAAKFDLNLTMAERGEGLTAWLEYNSDLYDSTTIARMLGHFQTLLAALVVTPDRRLADLPLLTETERVQLQTAWNDTEQEYLQDLCVHALFDAQAARTPQAIAVTDGAAQLTYHELNERANRLASYLRSLGVAPEVRVGLCVDRSVAMMVGLLGILKAGGAYVPLDPTYPKDRLAFMLQDAGVRLLITQTQVAARLPEHDHRQVFLDTGWEESVDSSCETPARQGVPETLMYVIYTSGSTGTPKGVQVPHRAVVNVLTSMRHQLGLGADDTLLSVTTLSFDIAVLELFLPLLVGARVVLASREDTADGFQLAAMLKKFEITAMQATPATWQLLLAAGWQGSPRLKIFCGGERLSHELASHLSGKCATLHNLYGPTETTIWSTLSGVSFEEPEISLGRPIANTQLYVLDPQRHLVPVSVPGELYIGGMGLTRGYHNRPGQTAERFIPDPFSRRPGRRLYATGDRVRYRPDGSLEYLGRVDHQVKIRGFRVELGEIETALLRHPMVREAAVMARDGSMGEQRLIGYIVPQPGPAPVVSEISSFLRQSLPDYMIPASILILDAFPRTPNGKVDRRALPAPEGTRPDLEQVFVAPSTPVEKVLAGIWAQVLGLQRVGIHDRFFDLGGDSLLSVQVIFKAQQAGLRLTPKQLFQYPTIAELARLEGTDLSPGAEQGQVNGEAALSIGQAWSLKVMETRQEQHRWNISRIWEVDPTVTPQLFEVALHHLFMHHDMLRARFVREAAGWRQFISGTIPGETVPFTQIDLSHLPDAEQGPAIERLADELQGSLNLSHGPTLRLVYFDLGKHKPGRVLFVVHRVLFDGFSMVIFLQDLQSAYARLSQNQPLQLLPKTTSVKQWGDRLRQYATSVKQELDYWRNLPWDQVARLPLDFPDGEGGNTVASMRHLYVSLSEQETDLLLRKVLKVHEAEVVEVLLMALVQSITRWTGGRWMEVTAVDSGRDIIPGGDDLDLSRTIGFFASSGTLLLERSDARHPVEVFGSIKSQLRAIPNRGHGFLVLLEFGGDVEISEQLKRWRKDEVNFNYMGQIDQLNQDASMFRVAKESVGARENVQNRRLTKVECISAVSGGRLSLDWMYGASLHKQETIEALTGDFMATLRAFIAAT